METVLGLSMTSTSVGWVLVDGSEAGGATLDHDAFDLDTGVTSGDAHPHAVAVRGAQAIAAASGHEIRSIGVTWTDDAEIDAKHLLESLRHAGWDNLVPVPLSQAAQEWAQGIGRELGYEMTAVCIIEPATVTVLTVDTGHGTLRSDVTHSRDSATADGLSQWLTAMFDRDHQPDSLLLVGSGADLDAIKGALDDALPMPVVASVEAQLVLARGAALAFVKHPDVADVQVTEGQGKAAKSRGASHTRALTISAAVVVGAGIAMFAVDSRLADKDSRPTEEPREAAASVTPAGVHPVSPTVSRLQTLAAEPPRAPAPTPEPPASLELPAQLAAVDDQPAGPATVVPVAALNEPIAAPPPAAAPDEPLPPPPVEPTPSPPDPIAGLLSPFFGALP